MRTCAFLTTDDLAGFITDDVLAEAPLAELGWSGPPLCESLRYLDESLTANSPGPRAE